MGRPWIILGAKGLLGQALGRATASAGIDALHWDRASCDITTTQGLRRIKAARPAVILNATAYTAVDKAEQEEALAARVNGEAVGHLAEVARAVGAVLVHYSTDFVFDGNGDKPYRETDRVRPLGAYGRTKALGEQAVTDVGGPHLILRTSWLFGPGGNCFPLTMLKAAAAGKPLSVVADQRGTPTHVDDLTDATMRLVGLGGRGLFHVTGTGETTWHEFALQTLERAGLGRPIEPISSHAWKERRPDSAPRPMYSVLDTSKYRSVTGQSPAHWHDMLDRFCTHPAVRNAVKG